ncbi:hypothetical protein ACFV5N_27835 [Streptomyces sp. NPDC059853]|uniref:hypothetical protein n=1 Tax=Streptomyces sp. NPDC059853 TaxID=3346973 RepID=UPI00365DE60E
MDGGEPSAARSPVTRAVSVDRTEPGPQSPPRSQELPTAVELPRLTARASATDGFAVRVEAERLTWKPVSPLRKVVVREMVSAPGLPLSVTPSSALSKAIEWVRV